MARAPRQPLDPLAVSAPDRHRTGPRDRRPSVDATFDPAAPRVAGPATPCATCGRRCCSAGGSRRTGRTRCCSAIYTVAKPIASLLLLVAMITIIGGSGNSDARTFVILGSALWAMLVAGLAGPAWSVLEDRERYRMLKYLYVSPATFLVLLVGRGGARLAAGRDGHASSRSSSPSSSSGSGSTSPRSSWGLLVVCLALGLVPILALGILLAAVCLQTRQESWSYPDAFAGALFLVTGVVFPLAILPFAVQASASSTPSRGGSPASGWRCCRAARARSEARARCGRLSPDPRRRTRRRSSSPCVRQGRWLHSPRSPSSGPASVGPATSGCWIGRPARSVSGSTGGGGRRDEGVLMRIYDGSPRQDFEEVFRSIGAFLDSHGMRDILLVEVPDGFIVQGLVAAGAATSAWSESVGSLTKETLTFLDDDIAKFMEEAAARRGAVPAGDAACRRVRGRPARDRPLDGRAEAQGRLPVRARGVVRRPPPRRGPGRRPPHDQRVHARRRRAAGGECPGSARRSPAVPAAPAAPAAGCPRRSGERVMLRRRRVTRGHRPGTISPGTVVPEGGPTR